MPIYDIVGIRRANYTRKSDNKPVSAYDIHLTYTDPNVDGYAVLSVFVSIDRLNGYNPALGDEVNVLYNRWGRVETVIPAHV